jgi:hypothetical protein
MPPTFQYRFGTLDDIDFITEIIIEAERAGTEKSSYERIFNINETTLKTGLKTILSESISGCGLDCESFILAEDQGQLIGGIASWKEGSGNQAGNVMKAKMLSYAFGMEVWMNAKENLQLVSEFDLPRNSGTLQFEDGYVIEPYRGQLVLEGIYNFAFTHYAQHHPELKVAQGFTLKGNLPSMITMMKAGFEKHRVIDFTNQELTNLLPGKGKIQWQANLKSE